MVVNSTNDIVVNNLLSTQYFRGSEASWEDLCNRIMSNFIKFDPELKNKEELLKEIFYNKLISLNSPALMNIGYSNQCSACFILDVEDSLESIYNTLKECALIFKSGAGVGLSLGALREKDSSLSKGGKSSGIISWMEQFDTMVNSVKQGGVRRGALLIALPVSHPDVIDFINAKTINYIKTKYNIEDDYTANIIFDKVRPFSNMNISVIIDNNFIYALKNNLNYNLISPKDKKIVKQVSAKEIWDMIVKNMYYYGEPGIIFDDRINADNPVPEMGKIKSSNPCQEVYGIPYQACALGTLNLYRIIKYYNISFVDEIPEKVKEIISLLVRLVDDIIDINNLPLSKIKEHSQYIRPIGIGVMDLAGALIKEGIVYGNNKKCIKYINNLFYNLRKEIIKSSISLAKEKGKVELPNLTVEKVFKGLDIEKESELVEEFKKYGIRNGNLMSMPPTGATGIIYGANSGGIEPLFALKYTRNILGNKYEIVPDIVLDICPNFKEERDLNEKQKSLLVTINDISIEDHLAVLNEISKYVDMSVSKTINFQPSITIEEVKNQLEKVLFDENYKYIKGVTIYRMNNNGVITNGNILSSYIGVIKRPAKLEGITSKIKYKDKNIYITVNFSNNRPVEVWLNGGNPGDELNAILWTCGWFISKYLQYGLPLNKMFQKMLSVDTSERYFSEHGIYTGLINLIFKEIYNIITSKLKTYFITNTCPKCNSPNYVLQNNCWVCYNCGYSKCG